MNEAEKYVTQGISFPDGLLDEAKTRAKAQRRSLSGYVAFLIESDIREAEQPTVRFARRGRPAENAPDGERKAPK